MGVAVNIAGICKEVENVLSLDLVQPRYRRLRPVNSAQSWGCCYVATEALYHLLSQKYRQFFKPHYLRYQLGTFPATHWFLRDGTMILDPTRGQFHSREVGVDRPIDYSKGTRTGFLTVEPSKRAMEIIRRVKAARRQKH